MAPNLDTRANLIAWFTMEFGFTINAATALHDVQALKDARHCPSSMTMTPLQMSARRLAKTSANLLPR